MPKSRAAARGRPHDVCQALAARPLDELVLAKMQLYRVQGLGGIWFGGTTTTLDSLEGALLSAIGLAEQLSGHFRYPWQPWQWVRRSHAKLLHNYFVRTVMFPGGRRGAS